MPTAGLLSFQIAVLSGIYESLELVQVSTDDRSATITNKNEVKVSL